MRHRKKRNRNDIKTVCSPCGEIKDILGIINDKNCMVADVRTKKEYSNLHVRNTVNIPLSELDSAIMNDRFKGYATIYTLCHSGERATKACKKLHKAGYANCICLGGIIDISDDENVII